MCLPRKFLMLTVSELLDLSVQKLCTGVLPWKGCSARRIDSGAFDSLLVIKKPPITAVNFLRRDYLWRTDQTIAAMPIMEVTANVPIPAKAAIEIFWTCLLISSILFVIVEILASVVV